MVLMGKWNELMNIAKKPLNYLKCWINSFCLNILNQITHKKQFMVNLVPYLMLQHKAGKFNQSTLTHTPKGLAMLMIEKTRSEEHTSELQSRVDLVCGLLRDKRETET